ncbi:MAG: nucleotide exchange factor GrpE, partial [Phascolarctobacterium sp.]|nr:nucleotide exchange factor GrpE [Candidatus Phascolarctobacterium equi]
MRGENPDLEEDTIDQVFEKGYKIRESVIRTSKVRVITK